MLPQALTGRVSREALEINILPRLNPWKNIRVFWEALEIERSLIDCTQISDKMRAWMGLS